MDMDMETEFPPEMPKAPSRWSGLRTRALSGAVLAAVALGALWVGGWLFTLLVVAASLQMLREWDALNSYAKPGWKILGIFYAAVPCASLIWLRYSSFKLVLFVMFVVWATDIGAYFAGRKIGGPKMAPTISPGKTWAGLGGGAGSAAVVAALCETFTPWPTGVIAAFFLGAVLALVAQGGDLFESWLKRRAGVKDSGTLIPGHGGLLDRVDGLTFTLPLFALLVALFG